MSAITRNTFQPKCETPGVVLTRVTPFLHSNKSDNSLRKMVPPINSLASAKEARRAASNYDQSLLMLSNSLEQICRKSTIENNIVGKDSIRVVPSPLISYSPPAMPSRPLSHNFKPPTKIPELYCNIDQSKSVHLLRKMSKYCSNNNIQIRVKHEETGDKLKEDLNKIISSSPIANNTEESPIVMIRKKLTDAQEFLRTKFRLKINTSKYPNEDSTNFCVVVNKTRLVKVTHVSSKQQAESCSIDQYQNRMTLSQDFHTTKPSTKNLLTKSVADSFEELDDPVNITTVLHSSTIPNSVRLERLLGSFIEGPFIYIRPSSMAIAEFSNTKLISIPILHINEPSMKFSLSIKIPSEIPIENIEIKRVDDILTIKGRAQHTDFRLDDSTSESTLKIKIELPEDSDGRSLIANFTPLRMLIIEGALLPNSRRMTCQF